MKIIVAAQLRPCNGAAANPTCHTEQQNTDHKHLHARNAVPDTGAGALVEVSRMRMVQASATATALMEIMAMRMRRFCSIAMDGATCSLEWLPISIACTDPSVIIAQAGRLGHVR
jgi:hypothetical protein